MNQRQWYISIGKGEICRELRVHYKIRPKYFDELCKNIKDRLMYKYAFVIEEVVKEFQKAQLELEAKNPQKKLNDAKDKLNAKESK